MAIEGIRGLIDLTDTRLFGNEAAEDEDPRVLESYFVDKPEFRTFENESAPLSIVSARKGVGKSALLSRVAYSKKQEKLAPLVISLTGADLVAQRPFKSGNPNELIYDWQQRLCFRINVEIGREIGLALDDNAISLVETSELAGFRDRNIIGSLVDRLKVKLVGVEVTKPISPDSQQLLQHYMEKHHNQTVWLFIDDIDSTFRRSDEECLRLSTFFSTCRLLSHSVKGLFIRTSVRTDVWATIRTTDEALDKCEQYILDLRWSRSGTRSILAKRIRSYISARKQEVSSECYDQKEDISSKRTQLIKSGLITPSHGEVSLAIRQDIPYELTEDHLLLLIFPQKFAWSTAGAHHVIHLYSASRPRWALQLCKLAAREAAGVGNTYINFSFIKQILERYGRYRINDLIREHIHQCPRIQDLIHIFARQRGQYTTEELLSFIEGTILRNTDLSIDTEDEIRSALPVAHFLFRIGFIDGRYKDISPRIYYRYEEKSHLLRTIVNPDEGMIWEIHPAFRNALNITGIDQDYD